MDGMANMHRVAEINCVSNSYCWICVKSPIKISKITYVSKDQTLITYGRDTTVSQYLKVLNASEGEG